MQYAWQVKAKCLTFLFGAQKGTSERTIWGVRVTLFAKPGCKVMRAKGPFRCQSSWAPKVLMRRNEEEALWTTRSPVTKGNSSLWPFNVTVPGNKNTKCELSKGCEQLEHRGYSTKVIYRLQGRKHMAGGERWNVQKQHVEPEYLHIFLRELIFSMNLDQTWGECEKDKQDCFDEY